MTKQFVEGGVKPGKIACHLEGSRASSMVTRAIDGSAARVGAGKISLFEDLIEDRHTSVRGEILIKRVHCVSYVLLSGVYGRRGLAFPYVIIIIIIKIRSCPCAVSGEREARLRRVAERSGRGPASDSCQIVRE